MTFEEFQKMDLRVATITAAERVQNSEKLVKLQLDIGELGVRQVIAGIGKIYTPDTLIGKQIIIVANLDPRMLMGEESNGMVLAAHGAEGEPILLVPDHESPAGSRVS